MRVPLINPVDAVVQQLDIAATHTHDPDGTPTVGYNPDLLEPYEYDNASDVRVDSTQYKAAIKVPCQVEMPSFEELRQEYQGDAPVTNIVLVFHRWDLEKLGLIDSNKHVTLKKNDKVTGFEKRGTGVTTGPTLADGALYIVELRPGSWGFGPDGHDLEIAFMGTRPALPTG